MSGISIEGLRVLVESLQKGFDHFYEYTYLRHHDRLNAIDKKTDETNFLAVRNDGRLTGFKRDILEKFEAFRILIIGNGKKGYVREKIEEELKEFRQDMALMIENAVLKAFQKMKDDATAKEEKKLETRGIRTWQLIVIVIGFLLNLAWNVFEYVNK